jgi:hypothetical protein
MAARYNLQDVNVVWGAIPVVGLAKDTAVQITYNNDFNSVQVSGDGRSNTRSVMNDRSATITLSVSQTSASQALLQAQFALQEAGAVSPGMTIEDLNTGAKFIAESCWVKKPPDASFGEEVGDWEWTFETDRLVPVYGDINLIENATA